MDISYIELDFRKKDLQYHQTTKKQFISTVNITHRDYRSFLLQTNFIDVSIKSTQQDNSNKHLILAINSQYNIIINDNCVYLIVELGRLKFSQAKEFGEKLHAQYLLNFQHNPNQLTQNQQQFNIYDYTFDNLMLLLSDQFNSTHNQLLELNAKIDFSNTNLLYDQFQQLQHQEKQVSQIVQLLNDLLSEQQDNIQFLNTDLIEIYLHSMQNLKHELVELINVTKIKQINQKMIFTVVRNDILKTNLIANFFLVSVAFCAMVFGFMGMNLDHGLEENKVAWFIVLFITLSISLFFFFVMICQGRKYFEDEKK